MIETGFGVVDGYPFEVAGWWWLPGQTEQRVRAVLKFDGNGQAELDSKPDKAPAGWFGEPSTTSSSHVAINIEVIHGQTGLQERPVSLIGCQAFGSNTGNSTLVANCRAVVDGLWINGPSQRVYNELAVEIEHLTGWAGRGVFGYQPAMPGAPVQEPVAWYWTPPVFAAQVGDDRTILLQWVPTYSSNPTVSETTIYLSYKAIFRVKWSASPVDLHEMWETAIVLQDLLTFATNRACAFIRVQLTAHDSVVADVTDPSFPKPHARIHAPGRTAPNQNQNFLTASQMVFGLADIDFPTFLSQWFTHHRLFRPVLATLLGQRYLPEQYAEPRLGMIVAAAEEAYNAAGLNDAFMTTSARNKARQIVRRSLRDDPRFAAFAERIGQQIDNRLTLEERLLHLADELGDLGERLLGQHRRGWAKAAKDARNKIAHTSSGGEFTGYQQTTLMLATRTVIEFGLLQRLGFTTESLNRIADRYEPCATLPSGLDWLPIDPEPKAPDTDAHLAIHIDALVSHVERLDLCIDSRQHNGYGHMGAILVDAILQAGMRYQTVHARAMKFRSECPAAETTSGLVALGGPDRLSQLLDWSGKKPDRIYQLALHLAGQGVETVDQLADFVSRPDNVASLRTVPGVGPKTADYLCILAGLSTAAVDTHLRSFASAAGIPALPYADLHTCYLDAAERLGVGPRDLDHAVWRHESGMG